MSAVCRYDKLSKSKKYVSCPNVIKCCISSMGVVDKSYMLVHLYKTQSRARRWYMRILGYLIDMCVCNAWLLHKRLCVSLKETSMPLRKFRLKIFRSMVSNGTNVPRVSHHSSENGFSAGPSPKVLKRGERSQGTPDHVRFNASLLHMPTFSKARQTCKHCSHQRNLHRSRWMRDVCNVAPCLTENANCFKEFHTYKK